MEHYNLCEGIPSKQPMQSVYSHSIHFFTKVLTHDKSPMTTK